jgi:DNA-directed RNA polymerase specialized sigma24 family protein
VRRSCNEPPDDIFTHPPRALDLTAETFAQAWLVRGRFRDEANGSAAPWVYGIARNVLLMSIRRGALERRATERLGLQEQLDRPQCVEDPVPESTWADGADELLDTLPAHQREAVRLRVLEDLEYPDVARAPSHAESKPRSAAPGRCAPPPLQILGWEAFRTGALNGPVEIGWGPHGHQSKVAGGLFGVNLRFPRSRRACSPRRRGHRLNRGSAYAASSSRAPRVVRCRRDPCDRPGCGSGRATAVVLDTYSRKVTLVNTRDRRALRPIKVGSYPVAIAIAPGTR